MWVEGNWSSDDRERIKKSIITLMEAAGEKVSVDSESKSIVELLESFQVGTEQRKIWRQRYKVPPKPSQLGPIEDFEFMSSTKRAKAELQLSKKLKFVNKLPAIPEEDLTPEAAKMTATENDEDAAVDIGAAEDADKTNGANDTVEARTALDAAERRSAEGAAETEASDQDNEEDQTDPVDYVKIYALMKAADCEMADSPCVGHKLIPMRAMEQLDGDLAKMSREEKVARENWKHLLELSNSRRVSQSSAQREYFVIIALSIRILTLLIQGRT